MRFVKKHYPAIIILLIFILGVGLLAYPFLSDYQNSRVQSMIQSEYKEKEKSLGDDTKQADLAAAEAYNNKLGETVSLQDPFVISEEKEGIYEEYRKILSLTEEGMIGSVEIPKIDVDLPIYHGVSDTVLEKGVGHVPETAFPIGQKGKHTLMAAHTGLSTAKLFTDLDQLVEGDMFFINLYGQADAYLVDRVEVVLPDDSFELLECVPEESYVTLMTCTPYGINTHRLMVRGKKVEYSKNEIEKAKEKQAGAEVHSTWINAYMKGLKVGILIVFVCFVFLFLFQKIRV